MITVSYLVWIFGSWDDFHHCCCDDTTYFKGENDKFDRPGLSIVRKIWTAEQDCCDVCKCYNWTNVVCKASDRMMLDPMYNNNSVLN